MSSAAERNLMPQEAKRRHIRETYQRYQNLNKCTCMQQMYQANIHIQQGFIDYQSRTRKE